MDSNIMISGPSSLYTFNFNGRLFVFFGDIHHSLDGNCTDKYNTTCNTFDNRVKNTNCWDIIALLDEWFTYNNNHKISTDFYLETPVRVNNALNRTILINPHINNISNGWIELIISFFNDCLDQRCKFNPTIRFHSTDARQEFSKGNIIENSIYAFPTYSRHLNPNSLISLLNVLMDTDLLLDLCFSNEDIRIILNNIPISHLDLNTQNVFNQVKQSLISNAIPKNGILMSRASAEYNKLLAMYPQIAHKLEQFVINNLTIAKPINMNQYEDVFMDLGSWIMDVYTISNMFTQQSQQIIAYTGETHIETYSSFLKYLGATLLAQYSTNDENRCVIVKSSTIPNFNNFGK